MSIAALNWAREQSTGSPAAKLVLMLIADRADERHSCWPSQQRIADESEQSVKSVRRHIQALQLRGLVRVERREIPGQHRATNRYVLPVSETRGQSDAQSETRGQNQELGDKTDPNQGTQVSPEPSVEPSVLNPQKDDAHFAEFWTAYPRKKGKGQAERAWAKAIKTTDPSVIVAAAVEFYQLCMRTQENSDFIPYPATWLNGKRWLDEPDPEPRARIPQQSNTQGWLALVAESAYNEGYGVGPPTIEAGEQSWT